MEEPIISTKLEDVAEGLHTAGILVFVFFGLCFFLFLLGLGVLLLCNLWL